MVDTYQWSHVGNYSLSFCQTTALMHIILKHYLSRSLIHTTAKTFARLAKFTETNINFLCSMQSMPVIGTNP